MDFWQALTDISTGFFFAACQSDLARDHHSPLVVEST
jgi:hypothetical protein